MNKLNYAQRMEERDRKIQERADQLYIAILEESDFDKKKILLKNLANMIIPFAVKESMRFQRGFSIRPVLVELGEFNYKIRFQNFDQPVGVERYPTGQTKEI